MVALQIEEAEGGVVFAVKVVPGASRTAVAGLLDGRLKVRVASPPEKGRANRCLCEFLAGQLGVRKAEVRVIAGQASPIKTIRVLGISADSVIEKLNLK